MDIKLIVIGKNQGTHLKDMDNQTKSIKNRLFVFDRCTDNSENIAKELNLDYIKTPDSLQGFQAGYARNLGAKGWDGNIIFLDGDRVPVEALTEDIIKEILRHYDLGLFLCERDIRQILDEEVNEGWGLNDNAGAVFNQCFSAGLVLSKEAVKKIRELCNGDLFHADFNGKWGEEDQYLGDCVYYSGLKIGYIPRKWSIAGEVGNTSYFNFYEEDWIINNRKRLEKRLALGLSNEYLGYPQKPKIFIKEEKFCITPFREFEISPNVQHLCDCDAWMQDFTDIVWDLNIKGIEKILKYDGEILFNKIRNKQYDFCYLDKCPFKRLYSLEELDNLKTDHDEVFVNNLKDYLSGKVKKYQGMPYRVKMCYDLSCNCSCHSCRPFSLDEREKDFSKYFETVKPLLKEARELYFNGSGEVFFSKHYLSLLRSDLREYSPFLKKIWIHTNLMLFDKDMYESIYNKDLLYRFIVSIDGVRKDTYERIRKGASWEVLLRNLNFLKSLKKDKLIEEIDMVFVFQKDNYLEMEEFVDFAKEYEANRVVFLGVRTFGYNNPIYAAQKVHKSYNDSFKDFLKVKEKLDKIKNIEVIFGVPQY